MSNWQKDFSPAELEAGSEYLSRKERRSHPKGDFDNAQRWFPKTEEICECCSYIRSPSRAYPFSYMLHCRTAQHVANLFGVDVKRARKAAKAFVENE